ncbi:fibronectin type III domain-containing protein [Paenibacillus koleovorans]|uniref:fibronectin type III domain-containing protein n=1 Tax=Paenibacillus koleovorans TaxID=121608 RepID=UPI00158034AE|nr:hypothetical protein [Paenibacillus koleovorans]BAB92974.2 sheath polysaccharide-degrading enzyme [Paenibacillus koleovorans]
MIKFRLFNKRMFALLLAIGLVCSVVLTVAPPALAATVYEVGPGKTYTSIGSVPFESLQPGDTVKIYYRSTPYKEKFVISRAGTSSNPITIQGVPGPNGELPIIDGDGATTRSQLNFWSDNRAVIKIGGARFSGSTSDPANGVLPKYIVIENLEVKNGKNLYQYTDNTGATKTYAQNAAAIFIEYGENITIRNNTITGSANGLFSASSDEGQTKNLLVEGNYIYGNGNPNRVYEHNIYTAGIGMIFQYNRIGDLCSGCTGNALKDRSAGTIIRYNHITGGNRAIDLVEGDDTTAISGHPDYNKSFVYGNVIIEPDDSRNRQIIHYGGDNGVTSLYRKGTLYLYNNTIITQRSTSTALVRLETADESADIRNNIVYKTNSGSTLSILDDVGTVNLTHNWLSAFTNSLSGGGTVNNDGTQVTGTSPGFVNLSSGDFHLTSASNAINAGTSLHSNASGRPVSMQYVSHQGSEARPSNPPIDIGAFEYAGSGGGDTQSPTAPTGLTANAVSSSQINLAWGASTDNVGVTGYRIYRGGSPIGTTAGTSYSDTGLTASTAYSYTVRAYDAATNESGNSNTANATTLSGGGGGFPIYLYDEATSVTFANGSGSSNAQVALGEGVGGSNALKYTNLTGWARSKDVSFSASPIDISSVVSSDKIYFSFDAGTGTSSQYRLVFNDWSWNGAPSVTFTPDTAVGYESFALSLSGIRTALGNQITKFYIERVSNAYPSATTILLDEVRFDH